MDGISKVVTENYYDVIAEKSTRSKKNILFVSIIHLKATRSIEGDANQVLNYEEKVKVTTLLGLVETKKEEGLRKECSKNFTRMSKLAKRSLEIEKGDRNQESM